MWAGLGSCSSNRVQTNELVPTLVSLFTRRLSREKHTRQAFGGLSDTETDTDTTRGRRRQVDWWFHYGSTIRLISLRRRLISSERRRGEGSSGLGWIALDLRLSIDWGFQRSFGRIGNSPIDDFAGLPTYRLPEHHLSHNLITSRPHEPTTLQADQQAHR